MGVGPIKRSGSRDAARGGKDVSQAGDKAVVGKSEGGFSAKVEKSESLAGAAGSSNVQATGTAIIEQASQIAKAVRSGSIASKSEATKKLVAGILKDRMSMQSKALEVFIADQLEGDPRLSKTLERIWERS